MCSFTVLAIAILLPGFLGINLGFPETISLGRGTWSLKKLNAYDSDHILVEQRRDEG